MEETEKVNPNIELNSATIIKRAGFSATTTIEFNSIVRRVPSRNGDAAYMIFEKADIEQGVYCRVYMHRTIPKKVLITRIIDYSVCDPMLFRETYFNTLAMPMIDVYKQLTEQVVFRGNIPSLAAFYKRLRETEFNLKKTDLRNKINQ